MNEGVIFQLQGKQKFYPHNFSEEHYFFIPAQKVLR